MLQTTVTFGGNIAADIALTYTTSGKHLVRFPVLVNRRRQDPDTGEWTDAEATRHSCTAIGTLGEHIADSLGKGDRILIVGTVTTDAWADKDTGEKCTMQRVFVDAAGPSLRWATARARKAQRTTAPTRPKPTNRTESGGGAEKRAPRPHHPKGSSSIGRTPVSKTGG